ncbi:MAG TPA: CARDB domain-containing protein [Kiritimatiellia bacterium]|nr:CARDB domain-containing protein [Kiritimatiellia bacterium]
MREVSRLNWVLRTFAVAVAVFVVLGIRPAWAAVDLRDGAVWRHDVSPTNAYPGDVNIMVRGGVSNAGSTASGYFYVGVYLSSDTNITTGDVFLGNYYYGSLGAWKETNFTVNVQVPYDTLAGTYYVGYVIDYSFAVSEGNENNNAVAITGDRLKVLPLGVYFKETQWIRGVADSAWAFMTAWNLSTGALNVSPSFRNTTYVWEHPTPGYQQWIARFVYNQGTGKTAGLAWYYRQSHVQ